MGGRIFATTMTAIAIAGLIATLNQLQTGLASVGFASGYVLLACVAVLASYNLRKKLPFLPLGASALWLKVHVYLAWFTMVAFGAHVQWQWPNGILETILFTLFMVTAGSGIYGLYLSIAVPHRLSRLREEVIYERIPALRLQVQERAHQLVSQMLQTEDAPALADFYAESLIPYFVGRRGLSYYLRPTSHLRNRLRAQLAILDRYLTESQRDTQQQLARLIDRRDDIDFHHAQQGRLKYWLFLHIAATYGLIIMALVHATLAHAFWGGAL